MLSRSEIDDISLLIKSLLDRIPIVVLSDNENMIEEVINGLADLIPFRNKLIYLSDFVDKGDFLDIVDYEESDLNVQRNVFLCFPNSTQTAIKEIDLYHSWIIGVLIEKKSYSNYIQVYNKLYSKANFFLKLEIDPLNLKTEIVGKVFPNLDLKLEKWIYQNAISRTELEIEKMRRIISKKTKFRKIPQEQKDSIMNFEVEENEIKENIIKKEILNFFNACKRSINILHRMQVLYNLNIKTNISPRVLYGTIAYKQAPVERILEFIDKEWGENYMHLLNLQNSSNFSDTFESLWG